MDKKEYLDAKVIDRYCPTCGEDIEVSRVPSWLHYLCKKYKYHVNMCPECYEAFKDILAICAINGVQNQIEKIIRMRRLI